MSDTAELEQRLARFVEHHVLTGASLGVESLCGDRPELVPSLRTLIQRYLLLTTSLEDGGAPSDVPAPSAELPRFEGFQTIERIGGGGMGEVYKLRDLRLNRTSRRR
jgi:hypothetical protein